MIWKKYGKKKCPNFQLLLCFGFCLSIWRLLSRLAAKKAPIKITDVSVGISESIFFYWTMVWNHWFLWSLNFSPLIYGFLGQFLRVVMAWNCDGRELWGEYRQNLVAILVVAAPYLSQPPTKNRGTNQHTRTSSKQIDGNTQSLWRRHRIQHVSTVALLFSAVFKGLGCWTCRQWFSWYKKLRLSIHVIVKAGDFGSRDHGGCAPGDSMIDTAALCGKGRIWS